jgi:hypothetical protein
MVRRARISTRPVSQRIIGLREFSSDVRDLGSNKKPFEKLKTVKPVPLDTGVIVALVDRNERYHGRSVSETCAFDCLFLYSRTH